MDKQKTGPRRNPLDAIIIKAFGVLWCEVFIIFAIANTASSLEITFDKKFTK